MVDHLIAALREELAAATASGNTRRADGARAALEALGERQSPEKARAAAKRQTTAKR